MVDLSILEGIDEMEEKKENETEKENYPRTLGLDREIEIKKKEIERLTNIYDNIKKSERLRSKINKDFINKTPIDLILLDCLEVISLMTGDTVFFKQNKKYLEKMTS